MNRLQWAGLAVLSLLLLTGALSMVLAQAGGTPPDWEVPGTGYSDLVAWGDRHIETSSTLLRGVDPTTTLVIVPGVRARPATGEVSAWLDLVEAGGVLLIADATGPLAGLLADLEERNGAGLIRLDHPVYRAPTPDADPDADGNDVDLPTDASIHAATFTHPGAEHPFTLILESPSSWAYPETRGGAQQPLSTVGWVPGAFIDFDGDLEMGVGEFDTSRDGATRVGISIPLGQGFLILVSDASWLEDRYLAQGDHLAYLAALRGDREVIIDLSTHPEPLLGSTLGSLLRATDLGLAWVPWVWLLVVMLSLLVVLGVGWIRPWPALTHAHRLPPGRDRTGPEPDPEVVQRLLRQRFRQVTGESFNTADPGRRLRVLQDPRLVAFIDQGGNPRAARLHDWLRDIRRWEDRDVG